jgi:hypothetical protein
MKSRIDDKYQQMLMVSLQENSIEKQLLPPAA